MKTTTQKVAYGLLITVVVFAIANFIGVKLQLSSEFLPYLFMTHTLMLIMSVSVIYYLREYVNYKIALPKFKKIFKPILFGLLATIIVNIFTTTITTAMGAELEAHTAITEMSPLQVFLFVFIYASIAEELLFRGFLMNILHPLKSKGIKFFKRHISLPVLISAIVFGLAHIILITTDAGGFFIARVIIFTTVLGIIAGYYQEKHDNNAYAIIVHMAGNFMGLISAILISVSEA